MTTWECTYAWRFSFTHTRKVVWPFSFSLSPQCLSLWFMQENVFELQAYCGLFQMRGVCALHSLCLQYLDCMMFRVWAGTQVAVGLLLSVMFSKVHEWWYSTIQRSLDWRSTKWKMLPVTHSSWHHRTLPWPLAVIVRHYVFYLGLKICLFYTFI